MPLVKKLKQKAWDSWRKSVDRGIRKLPKGAVSFHYRVFEKGNFRWQEIDALREMFGLTDLYLFHGVAMENSGRGIVLTGPPGVGKSSTLRGVVRAGAVKPLEDGIVLVGKKRGGFFVLESGNYSLRKNISKASKIFRVVGKSVFTREKPPELLHALKKKTTNATVVASEWIGSVVSADRSRENFEPRIVKLGKLIYIPHKRDPLKPKKIRAHQVTQLEESEMSALFGKGLLAHVSPTTPNLKAELKKLILGS